MSEGYTGISFPFRIGNKGGVVLSTTSMNNVTHIEESIHQVLNTSLRERVMEVALGCEVDTHIFDPNVTATHNIIKYEVKEALDSQEPRIKVELDDIVVSADDSSVYIDITYLVISYGTKYSSKIYIGGRDNGK